MNLYFVDEFKNDIGEYISYGIVLVRINNASYSRFKKGFYNELRKLGWDEKIEIKGRYSFSSTKGDAKIPIVDRLNFVTNLFKLSSSSSGSYCSADVYYTFEVNKKPFIESDVYIRLLTKVIDKLSKGTKASNKNGKNNSLIFMDQNRSVNYKLLNDAVEASLAGRGLQMIEKCIMIDSDNKSPGIIFADHIAFFVSNYFKTKEYNEFKINKIKELLMKNEKEPLTTAEDEELHQFIISYRKEKKSSHLLSSLKKFRYIE